ncbi:MAG: trimethyllysine dioxygenase [Deltaproteobacteria bacterium]|nr:trimethyllysine dioxygenase [Deltaproteobacteria bacterium]
MSRLLESIQAAAGAVELRWRDGGGPTHVPWFWLRDHCQCSECIHPHTLQRMVDTFSIPADVRPSNLALVENGTWVEVDWEGDAHKSRYPSTFLATAEVRRDAFEPRYTSPVLWDGKRIEEELPSVRFEELHQEGSDGLLRLLEKVERYGLCFVRGTPPTEEATERLAELISYIRVTIFGGFWGATDEREFADTGYTTLAITPHTDGTYVMDAPGLMLFHCIRFEGSGGENTFVDGFRVAEILEQTNPKAFQLLSTVEVLGQYLGDGVHLRARRPVFRLNEAGRLAQISYNNHDRAPFRLPDEEMAAFYEALRAFNRLIEDPNNQLKRRLLPGELLLFDNWRVLHGREAYEGKRDLIGCYFNWEDFESRLRLLRAELAAEA